MKNILRVVAFAALIIVSTFATAAMKTVTLSVPGMQCPVCVHTVKRALTKIDGVSKAEVSLDKKEATVMFDNMKINVDALRKATADAGFPSSVKPQSSP